jgi:membrane fusion protein (multidrug efflux system)
MSICAQRSVDAVDPRWPALCRVTRLGEKESRINLPMGKVCPLPYTSCRGFAEFPRPPKSHSNESYEMKRIFLVIAGIVVTIGLLGGVKFLQFKQMADAAESFSPPPATVTTARAREMIWQGKLTSVGTLEAVQGVKVSAELPGKVVKIAFQPGAMVKKGALLLRQDTSSERAQLRAVRARLRLAKTNLTRVERLVGRNALAQAELDTARATFEQTAADADGIVAAIEKKTIRAPFSGRLGIRLVNDGQVLSPGDAIVSLQSIDPIFVNFQVPQQHLSRIATGLTLRITSNALPGEAVKGTVTALNPQVDSSTRNVEVQGTIGNSDERLRPGMFVNVEVGLPESAPVVAIPATAVLYAPYSDSVFVVKQSQSKAANKTQSTIEQRLVRLGEKRGDFVTINEGLEAGDVVVSTGVFKLRGGQAVVVNNDLSPRFEMTPTPNDE